MTDLDDARPIESTPAAPIPERRRRPVAAIVLSSVLAIVLIAAAAVAAWLLMRLDEARTTIDEQRQEIEDQQQEIEDQRELIEHKELFGAAMGRLYDSIEPLIGLPFATLVPWGAYDVLASQAWSHRWDAEAMQGDIARADELAAELESRKDAARAQASANASGTAWETTLDRLGAGWVSTSFADATTVCGGAALACVTDTDPYVVHVTEGQPTDGSMTDWIRTGVAYHEYAHVLQATNPDATARALDAFGGDYETMADCYALTFLDGWTLDHRVHIDAYSYWEVSVGYGHSCDESQRQVVRDWVAGLGVVKQTVGG